MEHPSLHDYQFCEERSLLEGFSFHPKLGEWLLKYPFFEASESIAVYEIKCEDNSCPVQETLFVGKVRALKVGKEKSKISKLDLQFAYEKQKNSPSLTLPLESLVSRRGDGEKIL